MYIDTYLDQTNRACVLCAKTKTELLDVQCLGAEPCVYAAHRHCIFPWYNSNLCCVFCTADLIIEPWCDKNVDILLKKEILLLCQRRLTDSYINIFTLSFALVLTWILILVLLPVVLCIKL